ncbi:copper chaperone CopZ [Desulfotomaculum varum]
MAETVILKVEGMSCQHCKRAVENAVQKIPGILAVEAVPEEKTVKITHDGSNPLAAVKEAITEEGYQVVE